MANTTISALASGTAPTGSEAIPADQGGGTFKLTPDQIVQRVSGAALASPIPSTNGGTGMASGLAHSLVLAQGVSAFTTVATGASGFILVSNGAGVDPGFAQNTLALLGIASGASGLVLTANGAGGASFVAPTPFSAVSGSSFIANAASGSAIPTAISVAQALALLGIILPPQGRLSLASGQSVMSSDVTGASGIFYVQHNGAYMPVSGVSGFVTWPFTLLSMTATTTGQVAGSLYDIFGYVSGGTTLTLGFGPAWSNSTAGSSVRGSGGGTTELIQVNGIWVNKNAINLRNGPTLTSGVAAGFATFLGSVYMSASGQTSVSFKPAAAGGGTNTIMGLSNAYNRVRAISVSRDTTTSWTYATNTWHAANSGAAGSGLNNRVSWLDCLGQIRADARYEVVCSTTGNSVVGVLFNATSGTPSGYQAYSSTAAAVPMIAEDNFIGLGLNFAQAAELGWTGTGTFFGSQNAGIVQNQQMLLDLEY